MRRFRKVHLMVVPVTLAAALPAMTVELASDKRQATVPEAISFTPALGVDGSGI